MRLDLFLVQKFNLESRSKAQELIAHQLVTVDNRIETKPSFEITELNENLVKIIRNDRLKYVSRAGLKLEGAAQAIQLAVENKVVLDIGQSTGGFTDYLVQHKAQQVIGIDVGEEQLHSKVKGYSNVISFEKLNVKSVLQHADFLKIIPVDKFDLIVCDVSFISLTQVVPHITALLKPAGEYLFLVKPQFECGPENLNKNGVIKPNKSDSVYSQIQKSMIDLFNQHWGSVEGYFESSILGKEGNKEFFIYGKKTKA